MYRDSSFIIINSFFLLKNKKSNHLFLVDVDIKVTELRIAGFDNT